MKKQILSIVGLSVITLFVFSCSKEAQTINKNSQKSVIAETSIINSNLNQLSFSSLGYVKNLFNNHLIDLNIGETVTKIGNSVSTNEISNLNSSNVGAYMATTLGNYQVDYEFILGDEAMQFKDGYVFVYKNEDKIVCSNLIASSSYINSEKGFFENKVQFFKLNKNNIDYLLNGSSNSEVNPNSALNLIQTIGTGSGGDDPAPIIVIIIIIILLLIPLSAR